MPICPNLARTAAIEVLFSINFAVDFNFTYFRFRPSNVKWICDVLPKRRNATIRSMFFSSFLMRIAYWRTESVCVLRQCAANYKKSPRNTNWKLKTLQFCCALPTGARESLRQYNGTDSNVPSLVLTQRFVYNRLIHTYLEYNDAVEYNRPMTQQIKLIKKRNAASNSPRSAYLVGHCLFILLYWGGNGNR